MKKIDRDFIPLGITLLLTITSIIFILFSEYKFPSNPYVGISLLLLSTILYFKKKNLYIFIFGITLLLGVLRIINFFFFYETTNLSGIKFNSFYLILLVIFLVFNKSKINEIFPEKEPTESEKLESKEVKENLIKSFEKNFKNKTENELKEIIAENSSYVSEAKIAAEKILNGKKYVL